MEIFLHLQENLNYKLVKIEYENGLGQYMAFVDLGKANSRIVFTKKKYSNFYSEKTHISQMLLIFSKFNSSFIVYKICHSKPNFVLGICKTLINKLVL